VTDPLVSVLLPTRGRPEALIESVTSLFETAGDDKSFEVLYAVDTDDEGTLEVMLSDLLRTGTDQVKVYPERHGYANLHEYINGLVPHARGQWLMLWNDDAIMQTYGWDWRIRELPCRFVLDCWTNHPTLTCTFPIVPRHWVQALGHFSLNAHCDTWWQLIGEWTHRLVRADIDVQHNRFDLTGRNHDQTYEQGRLQHQTVSFYSAATTELIKQDASVVLGLVEAQRNRRLQGRTDWE
jgi:hypothetical protein